MSYGFASFSDNGALLVNSASPAYRYFGKFNASTRVGNVNTYNFSCPAYPLVFVEVPDGLSGSVLSVTGGYTVQCLTNAPAAAIHVFIPTSGTASGVGTAVYGESGQLLFDSNQVPLSSASSNTLNEGGSFTAPSGTNMIAYTGGHVRPESSVTRRTEQAGTDIGVEQIFVCDPFSGFCYFDTIIVVYVWFVIIDRTNWVTYRSVARRNGNTYTFDWLVHESGYYDTPVLWYAEGFGTGTNVPPSFVSPGLVIPGGQFAGFDGQFTRNNTFPYTTSRYNMITAACITARKEDHE